MKANQNLIGESTTVHQGLPSAVDSLLFWKSCLFLLLVPWVDRLSFLPHQSFELVPLWMVRSPVVPTAVFILQSAWLGLLPFSSPPLLIYFSRKVFSEIHYFFHFATQKLVWKEFLTSLSLIELSLIFLQAQTAFCLRCCLTFFKGKGSTPRWEFSWTDWWVCFREPFEQ